MQLTSDTEHEIITFTGAESHLPAHSTLFPPFLRIYSSFITKNVFLRIRNS